jgi:mono/diheme cytochrome c family protein
MASPGYERLLPGVGRTVVPGVEVGGCVKDRAGAHNPKSAPPRRRIGARPRRGAPTASQPAGSRFRRCAQGSSRGARRLAGRLLLLAGAPPGSRPMKNLTLLRFAHAALMMSAVATAACSSDPDSNGGETGDGDAKNGAALYAEMCAGCHGNAAEGGLGPRLVPWKGAYEDLVTSIDTTMPKGDPDRCDEACAEDIATYLTGLTVDCQGPRALPRRLRLLTRREYRATVADLLQASVSASSSCQADTDCNLANESCTGGVCTADPCTLHTFTYEAGGSNPASVHVAGSFNGWPGTVGAGGWAMAKIPGTSTWYVKHEIPAGSHEYKLVINESQWISDPKVAQTVGDFGNSPLTISCNAPPGGGGLGFDPAKDFPSESRPTSFAYDNHESALVTNVHVDQYWKAAALLADAAMSDVVNLLPCDIDVDPEACAEDFVVDFGKRAFRRPLDVTEVARYKAMLLGAPDRQTGIRAVVRTLLSSPMFLYRSEIGVPAGNGTHKLTPHETATALSYMFWGSMPDEELFAAADAGKLATKAGIEEQARRLIKSPKSRPVFETFAAQWLGVEKVPSLSKTPSLYPAWNEALATSMVEETRRFVTHVIFDGSHKFEELLLADYTFADPTLAAFYGTSVSGSGFEKVTMPENRKAGLLGHAGILSANAYADQSSPIKRGLFVRRALLCQELPAPPANAATVPQIDPNATTRERFAQHTADPTCKSCHQYIDDVGFGFEKFDAVGQYREMDNGQPVDASGDMNDVEGLGTNAHAPYMSLRELAEILADSKSSEACFARQSYRFAMGRLENNDDVCGLSELSAAFDKSGGDILELWVELAKLDELTTRK